MTTESAGRPRPGEGSRIAGYCAALAGASLAGSAEAAVVSLSFSPGDVP